MNNVYVVCELVDVGDNVCLMVFQEVFQHEEEANEFAQANGYIVEERGVE